MDQLLTSRMAGAYANVGKLEKWVQLLLKSEGNREYDAYMRSKQAFFVGPIRLSISLLKDCCTPDNQPKYVILAASFEDEVQMELSQLLSGQDIPPLVIEYKDNTFYSCDNYARYAALRRAEKKQCSVIIWTHSGAEYETLRQKYEM